MVSVAEEVLVADSDKIIQSFMEKMQFQEEQTDEADEIPRLRTFVEDTRFSEVGQRLAIIGDVINTRYEEEFNSMVKSLSPSADNITDIFFKVGTKFFSDGEINWGRIITLLCFGYRLAVNLLAKGIYVSLKIIVSKLIKFLVEKHIMKWIAEQGGWQAVLSEVVDKIGCVGPSIMIFFALSSLVALKFYKKE